MIVPWLTPAKSSSTSTLTRRGAGEGGPSPEDLVGEGTAAFQQLGSLSREAEWSVDVDDALGIGGDSRVRSTVRLMRRVTVELSPYPLLLSAETRRVLLQQIALRPIRPVA
jgi:hypothetical protein